LNRNRKDNIGKVIKVEGPKKGKMGKRTYRVSKMVKLEKGRTLR